MQPAVDEQILRIIQESRRLGLPLVEDGLSGAGMEPLYCVGYLLPPAFTWFCTRHAAHAEWPHYGDWPGIYSPLGSPSPIDVINAERRAGLDWPKHLVTFSTTDDGDYCFAYDGDLAPYVAYVDHWANAPADEDAPRITASREHANFAEWFSRQVDWLLSGKG
jgi:hypothetical protein